MFSCGLLGITLLMVCCLSLTVTSFPFKSGNGYWRRRCEDMVEADNSTCKDGMWKNPCGKWACLNGLGSECDEPRASFRFGECADGLVCSCGKCQGCLKGECYSKILCHKKASITKKVSNYLNGYPTEYPYVNPYNEY